MIDRDRAGQLLAERRAQLEQLRQGLDLSGSDEQEDLSALSSADQHPADIGTETFNRESDFSLLEQIEGELERLGEAEQRLRSGTYGTCEICGRAISEERLEAMPETARCIDHAETGAAANGGTEPTGEAT